MVYTYKCGVLCEFVYFCLQEVVLQRPLEAQKLGLTLCYGSLEDETTDIFISEVRVLWALLYSVF